MPSPTTSKTKKGAGLGLAAVLLATPMVAFFEGTVFTTYADPVGIPTVCIGETDKEIVSIRKQFTAEECAALLGASLMLHSIAVDNCIEVPIKQREAAAILSWSYNIGTNAACTSTLMRKLNDGAPAAEWCAEMKNWVYAKKKKLNGLVARRESEYKMCMTGVWK